MSVTPSRRLLHYLRRYRSAFATGFACAIAASTLSLAGPWLLKRAVDDLVAGVTLAKIRGYSVAIFAVVVAGTACRYANRRAIMNASRAAELDLRRDLFAHLQRLDFRFFQQTRTGDLMARATNDLNAIRLMLGPAVMFASTEGVTFTVGVALMLSIDPWLAAVALLPLPLVTVMARVFGRRIHDAFARVQAQFAAMNSIAQESLAAVRVVRAYRQEQFEIDRFGAANADYLRQTRAQIALQALYLPTIGLVMGVGSLLVLLVGSRRVVSGRISIGDLVAFQAYLMMMTWPMVSFGWINNAAQRGLASWKRLLQVLDTAAPRADPIDGHRLTSIRPSIEFRHLTFRLGSREILHDVSASLPAGSVTAIVGPVGSGKSTLVALLARVYEPPEGTVLVGGTDVRQLPIQALRGSIGFVTQEPALFTGTIAENVAFAAARPPARAQLEAAAALACLDADLPDFPQGYDTLVGERGVTLSGGQKQRTAIARALLGAPDILVLDDALSAVDAATEEEMLRRIASSRRRMTVLLVSHRVSVVRGADQILVLDGGRIVERGTHRELVLSGGLYATLDRQQQLQADLVA